MLLVGCLERRDDRPRLVLVVAVEEDFFFPRLATEDGDDGVFWWLLRLVERDRRLDDDNDFTLLFGENEIGKVDTEALEDFADTTLA